MLQAILEARACGTGSGDAQFRWDYNADGDFNDGGEGWTDAGVNGGTYYFHYTAKDFRLPTFLAIPLSTPRSKLAAGTNPADPPSAVMPVLVRRLTACAPNIRKSGMAAADRTTTFYSQSRRLMTERLTARCGGC